MSQVTKRALEQSLKNLLLKKPLTKITINDIAEDCGINRMTFYYHFKDIYDLVEWSCLEDARRALEEKKTHDTWQQGLLQIFEAVRQNKPFILNVYRCVDREQVERYLRPPVDHLILGVIDEQSAGMTVRDEDKAFIAQVYGYIFIGIMLDWIRDGMAEEPEKILVASASIHGHTRAAAHLMAEKLRAKGAKVVEMDLTRTDVSYAVTEAFRCGKIVLACATYDGFLFPPMENLLAHLKTKNFQSRTVGLMENGTWAPMAAKLMRAELEGMKNITVCENVVTIRSAANDMAKAQMDALADELVLK